MMSASEEVDLGLAIGHVQVYGVLFWTSLSCRFELFVPPQAYHFLHHRTIAFRFITGNLLLPPF